MVLAQGAWVGELGQPPPPPPQDLPLVWMCLQDSQFWAALVTDPLPTEVEKKCEYGMRPQARLLAELGTLAHGHTSLLFRGLDGGGTDAWETGDLQCTEARKGGGSEGQGTRANSHQKIHHDVLLQVARDCHLLRNAVVT